MEQENDAKGTPRGDDNGPMEASGKVVTEGQAPPSQQENASKPPNAADEEQEKDLPAADEGSPAEDADAAAIAPPSKRKSHRPSLEVVEVKVDSFYDKDSFKQELQVGGQAGILRTGEQTDYCCRFSGRNNTVPVFRTSTVPVFNLLSRI